MAWFSLQRLAFLGARILVAGTFLVAGIIKSVEHVDSQTKSADTLVAHLASTHPMMMKSLAFAEIFLGLWLASGYRLFYSHLVAVIVTGAFTGVILTQINSNAAKPCGCFGSHVSGWSAQHPFTSNLLGVALNVLLAGASIFVLGCLGRSRPRRRFEYGEYPSGHGVLVAEDPKATGLACRKGWSLIELLVAVSIVAVLLTIVAAASTRVAQHAKRASCASNLQQIGIAFQAYAAEYKGVVPRYAPYHGSSRGPVWLTAILPHVGAPRLWGWDDLPRQKVLHCPSHPKSDIPSSYVLNCFAPETAPRWRGAPPLNLSAARRPSGVGWLLEAPDEYGTRDHGILFDDIYFEQFHVARSPAHLPGGAQARLFGRRHLNRSANVLFLDWHVSALDTGKINLALMDDGIRSRQ